jgi:SWI/SNF-related matrix-associated actin-dependent regulator of chromatin subfamily A-like protein 1
VIDFKSGYFIASGYEYRDSFKRHAWWYLSKDKTWTTTYVRSVIDFVTEIDADWVKSRLLSSKAKTELLKRTCHAVTPVRFFNPTLLKNLKPYQREALDFSSSRNHSYLALEQGLGKTLIGITLIDSTPGVSIIICPPHLIDNWLREFDKWGIRRPEVLKTSKDVQSYNFLKTFIVPDSLIVRNFKILKKFKYELMLVDEGDRFNTSSKRTKALLTHHNRLSKNATKVTWLSGTPIRNRPVELWPILSALAYNTIDYMDYYEFCRRYCDMKSFVIKGRKILDVSGSSNLEELAKKIKPFMLRMDLKDKTSLKEVREKLIALDHDTSKEFKELEDVLSVKYSIKELVGKEGLGDIAEYRAALSLEKIEPTVSLARRILKTKKNLIIFTWHRELSNSLVLGLKEFKAVKVDGSLSSRDKEKSILSFKIGDSKILIGQISTMVGYNLPECNTGLFAESSWVPSLNAQAISRMNRIGQTKEVSIYYLSLRGSLDYYVLKRVLEKREDISKLTNELKGE